MEPSPPQQELAQAPPPTERAPRPADHPWGFVASPGTQLGSGPCVGRSLASILDEIRAAFPDVADVHRLASIGPVGVTMVAGAPVRAGEPPPPATEVASFIVGLTDGPALAAVFFKGERCRGDSCEDRRYWYFDTDASCRPFLAGHHRAADRMGGRYGTCVDIEGAPMWRYPGLPDPRRRCDADWSAQRIAGSRPLWSLDPTNTCSSHTGVTAVDLVIDQRTDLAKAQVTFTGTGIGFIDGRPFEGTVERQSFAADVQENVGGACSLRRKISVRLDFERPSINGIPGGVGLVEISEVPDAACTSAPSACTASLHLLAR